jgi:hypothetical protein
MNIHVDHHVQSLLYFFQSLLYFFHKFLLSRDILEMVFEDNIKFSPNTSASPFILNNFSVEYSWLFWIVFPFHHQSCCSVTLTLSLPGSSRRREYKHTVIYFSMYKFPETLLRVEGQKLLWSFRSL